MEHHSNTQLIKLCRQKEEDNFVMQTMLTCIGNKRKLVNNIYEIIDELKHIINKPRLNIVDAFAGSSVVSRKLCTIADNLYINDMEYYAYLMAKCFLIRPSLEDQDIIKGHIEHMNQLAENGEHSEGIICKYYAPKDTHNIQKGERCFYTRENALIIDTLRKYITENVQPHLQVYCLVPLLNKASIHTNTSGVFKGFYKKDNIGCFGGNYGQALSRIMKPIRLDMPIWSQSEYKPHCENKDINVLIAELPTDIDIIYLDPPYNQHPYGSNYFMLNVIAKNEEPINISKVSGIPANWKKSSYNSYASAIKSMKELIDVGLQKAKYILISYNNEGIISSEDWNNMLVDYQVKKYEIIYDTFKGCRNLHNRDNKVIEVMYLITKVC